MTRLSSGVFAQTLASPAFDANKPYRTRDGRRVLNLRVVGMYLQFAIEGENLRNTHRKFLANGCSYATPDDHQLLGDDLVNIVEDTAYTRRSIRPGKTYTLRDGRAVEIVSWEADPDAPIVAMFDLNASEKLRFPGRTKLVVEYHKSGRIEPNGKDHPQDIVEVNVTITKWVRAYDAKPLDDDGKRSLSGRKFNSAIALHWYLFDTELEARASLQGVRAVFPVTYTEGQGIA